MNIQVALKNVIDNIGSLAVEACLIQKLPTLFMADTVYDLEDTTIHGLAGESNEVVEEREKAAQKLKLLQNCLHDLKRLDKYGATHSQRTVGQDITGSSAPVRKYSKRFVKIEEKVPGTNAEEKQSENEDSEDE